MTVNIGTVFTIIYRIVVVILLFAIFGAICDVEDAVYYVGVEIENVNKNVEDTKSIADAGTSYAAAIYRMFTR